MEEVREEVIIAALEDLDQGQAIENILDRYPQQVEELRPILEAAAGLGDLVPTPSPDARKLSRQTFLAEAQRLRTSARPEGALPRWRRFFYSFASFALFMVLLGVIVIPPAGDAIPGDLLYPVKRSIESAQLFLASPEEREALRAEHEQERNHEVYEMLDLGRDGRAGYVGILEAIDDDAWEIGHITAHIVESTEITGNPEIGARVEAHCLVQDGKVIAESLTILEPPPTIGPPES